MNRGIFLDRDGVLNALVFYEDTGAYESPRSPVDFSLLPGVTEALARLRQRGWFLFVISNQPSFAKGKTSLENLQSVHTCLEKSLFLAGVALQGAYYCYHHPEGIVPAYSAYCRCRKPSIESLLKAQTAYELDLQQCWMVGDQDSDVQCGQNGGCRTILIDYAPSKNKRGNSQPDYRCADLMEAVEIILGSPSTPGDWSC